MEELYFVAFIDITKKQAAKCSIYIYNTVQVTLELWEHMDEESDWRVAISFCLFWCKLMKRALQSDWKVEFFFVFLFMYF